MRYKSLDINSPLLPRVTNEPTGFLRQNYPLMSFKNLGKEKKYFEVYGSLVAEDEEKKENGVMSKNRRKSTPYNRSFQMCS